MELLIPIDQNTVAATAREAVKKGRELLDGPLAAIAEAKPTYQEILSFKEDISYSPEILLGAVWLDRMREHPHRRVTDHLEDAVAWLADTYDTDL